MKKILSLALFLFVPFLGGCSLKQTLPVNQGPTSPSPIACTAEAKICPDGSSVGRVGPNCEFAACPEGKVNQKTISLKVFYNNSNLNPNSVDCSKVYPLERAMVILPENGNTAQIALQELVKGPTSEEKSQGYISWFSDKTRDIIKNVKTENETAYVNLSDIRELIPNASASCGSTEFIAEIENTLKQFPNIKKVIFAIDKQPTLFYEWIQIGCNPDNDNCNKEPFSLIETASVSCANVGENIKTLDMTTGKLYNSGKECCSGLKEVFGKEATGVSACSLASGVQGICLPCGNKKCDVILGEDNCNCPEDCPNKVK